MPAGVIIPIMSVMGIAWLIVGSVFLWQRRRLALMGEEDD
jgi:hypothetical protein